MLLKSCSVNVWCHLCKVAKPDDSRAFMYVSSEYIMCIARYITFLDRHLSTFAKRYVTSEVSGRHGGRPLPAAVAAPSLETFKTDVAAISAHSRH